MSSSLGQINVEQEFTDKLTLHKNLGQAVVITTVDKIRLCLMTHKERLVRRDEWLMPLGFFVSLVTTLVAADFKHFVFDPLLWRALFLLSAIFCFCWLVIASRRAWIHRNAGDIEDIIKALTVMPGGEPGA